MASPTPTTTLLATITATVTQGVIFSTLAPIHTGIAAIAQTILDPSHPDPTRYNPANPIVLFVIQVVVIIGTARILSFFLGKIRQPLVISEVLGGIILGPTAFGRIPGFTAHIFPAPSIPFLSLVAEIGLIFFLFLIGLEIDFSLFRANSKISASVSAAGILIPFGLGCATSVGLYSNFIDPSTPFSHFMLFIGTSMSITAFPVLARILTELNLVNDKVGAIVLSAGVADDVIGWTLLALTIALVNSSSGIVVLYIILCAIGWILCLWFVIRPVFYYLARRSGSFDGEGPTQSIVCLTLLLVLVSAWITDQIGINGILGGFLVGIIIPRERGFATHLTEKIEDLVTVLFVPIFFTLSGLKTNLGLLNSGLIWGYAICVIVVAFSGKFLGTSFMASRFGFTWRECGAVGSLMSCKGLIELIVLNIGLSAGVISPQVFAIFVLEALTLTFCSTPLTLAFYPAQYRHAYEPPRVVKKVGEEEPAKPTSRSRFVVVLSHLSDLSPIMIFTKLLSPPNPTTSVPSESPNMEKAGEPPFSAASDTALLAAGPASTVSIDTVRLLEITDRTSALLHASHQPDAATIRQDPLSSLFKTFATLNNIQIRATTFSVVARNSFAETVTQAAESNGSQFIVVPWTLGHGVDESVVTALIPNPLESLFERAIGGKEDSTQSANFVRQLFVQAKTDVGIFIEPGETSSIRGTTTGLNSSNVHLFLAFHGGSDDRTCLEFILQLVQGNKAIRATIVRIIRAAEPTPEDQLSKLDSKLSAGSATPTPQAHPVSIPFTIEGGGGTLSGHHGDTVYGTHNHLVSSAADDVAFARAQSAIIDQRLPISLSTIPTAFPLRTSIAQGQAVVAATTSRVIVIAGRGRRDAASHRVESAELIASLGGGGCAVPSSTVRKTFGEVASAFVVSGVGNNVLIIQCRTTRGAEGTA